MSEPTTEQKKTIPEKTTSRYAPARGGAGDRGKGKGKGRRSSRPGREAENDGFDQKIIDIARVTRVMAGGKRMSFRACVVVGNRKGKVGMAIRKGADVSLAVNKATTAAKKELIDVKIVEGTIPHRIRHKFKAAKILLKPATQGVGIIAGGAMRPVLELSGVTNVIGKILGSNSKINNVRATIEALSMLTEVDRSSNIKK